MSTTRATIEDVADAAGVSVATVSRALRGLPNVAPATRERVQQAAGELHYRPDPFAARLATGRTTTIAMAVPVLASWYFAQVMAGAEAVASEAGYDLLIFAVDSDSSRRRVLRGPLVKRADGLILVDLRIPTDEANALGDFGVNIVTIGMSVDGASRVEVDDLQIGRDATNHLLDLGHRDIALLAGLPDDPMRFTVPELRRQGFHEAMAARGVAVRRELEVGGNFSVEGGAEAMAQMLELERPPTAVFAMSDEMAFGAMRVAWDRGLRIPEDVSIVGVDDHEFSRVIGLTTMQQEVAEHGAVAARLLLDRLEGPVRELEVYTAQTRLLIRASTAAIESTS